MKIPPPKVTLTCEGKIAEVYADALEEILRVALYQMMDGNTQVPADMLEECIESTAIISSRLFQKPLDQTKVLQFPAATDLPQRPPLPHQT